MKTAGIKWVTLLVLVFCAVSVSAQSDLTVKVKNIRSAKGKVMIAADKGQYAMADATGDTVTLVLKEVPEGKCKLYVYHDENGNYQLDRVDGVPTENCAIVDLDMTAGAKTIDVELTDLRNKAKNSGGASYITIFSYSLGSCILGFLAATMVKTPYKPPVKREPISLDRFILLKGLPAGFSLLLLSIPYGMTTNYVAMYAKQIGITAETGFFFTLMAVGMAISRLFSGRLVDKGMITQVISAGLYLVCICYFGLTACGWLINWNNSFTIILFFLISLLLGIGFGTMFPAYNTLFVNLAPNSQRGTATSTYLTSWDVGLGIGMLSGGYIAEIASFRAAYLFGAFLTVVSVIYFHFKAGPHFLKNKLR